MLTKKGELAVCDCGNETPDMDSMDGEIGKATYIECLDCSRCVGAPTAKAAIKMWDQSQAK